MDLDIILGSQENIQPLRGGRKVAQLVTSMSMHADEKKDMKAQFERKVRDASCDLDSLERLIEYKKWMQTVCPAGGDDVKRLLERIVNEERFYRDDFRNNRRYVEIWLEYVNSLESRDDKLTTLNTMKMRGIGQKLAIYYETHALIFELAGNYTESSRMYCTADRFIPKGEAGDERKRLDRHKREFEERMKAKLANADAPLSRTFGQPKPQTDENGHRHHGNARPMRGNGNGNDRTFLNVSNSNSGTNNSGSGGSTFAVFQETGVGAAEERSFSVPSLVGHDRARNEAIGFGAAGAGASVGLERERTKENRQIPSQWTSGLGNENSEGAAPVVGSASASFTVFRDGDENSNSNNKRLQAPKEKEKDNEVTAVARDPDGRRPGEVPAYNVNLIFVDGQELQFEEVRAAHYPYIPPPELDTENDNDESMDISMEMEQTEFFVSQPPQMPPSEAAASVVPTAQSNDNDNGNDNPFGRSSLLRRTPSKDGNGDGIADNRNHSGDDGNRKVLSTPTLPTPSPRGLDTVKGRLSFSSDTTDDAEADREGDGDGDARDNTQYSEHTEHTDHTFFGGMDPTIKTKLALDDVLNMFSGDLNFDEDGTMTAHGMTFILNNAIGKEKPSVSVIPASKQVQVQAATVPGFSIYKDTDRETEEDDTDTTTTAHRTKPPLAPPIAPVASSAPFSVHTDNAGEQTAASSFSVFQDPGDEEADNSSKSKISSSSDVGVSVGVENIVIPVSLTNIAPAMFDQTEQNSLMNARSIDIGDLGNVYMRPPKYTVGKKIGDGGYASIFDVKLSDNGNGNGRNPNHPVVVKVQSPPCPWEYYIMKKIKKNNDISESLQRCFLPTHSLHVHNNKSSMLMQKAGKSLQVAINVYRLSGENMHEILVMFYAAEAARIIEGLHAAKVIHCDVKPDNFLIRMEDTGSDWGMWTPARKGPWSGKGLSIVDFGCAIDCSLFNHDTLYTGASAASAFKCPAMLEERPWGTNQDLYGLASTIHFLLFGEYMQVQRDENGVYSIKSPMRRYWHAEMWTTVFEALLNAEPECVGAEYTKHSTLFAVRRVIEESLGDKSRVERLKMMLIKHDIMVNENASRVSKK